MKYTKLLPDHGCSDQPKTIPQPSLDQSKTFSRPSNNPGCGILQAYHKNLINLNLKGMRKWLQIIRNFDIKG